ncbi:hypothetical protein ACMA1I_09680 [Pontibacter sp. 13R65]|uniref:hypothetical protein n=1 Tax=Pontibacter sp. 13R65 TaxID=3127458 RepID=UPI00301BC699
MKRVLYTFVLFTLVWQPLFAQQAIETRLGYTYNDKFEFSDEWQYLSTDLFLFNGSKFNRVLNEVESGVKKNKKNYSDNLEYLFITAQLKNIKLFGNDEIVYPLYNFNVTTDSKKEYSTQVSDHQEVVRIIDKMPLTTTNNSIDALIQAKAITNDQSDQMFGLVATQLTNISKLASSPPAAVLSLVGEFGNLLSARTKRKEYKFSSTIRLYEGQDFDTRLHSVRIYVFVPGEVKAVTIKPAKLEGFLNKGVLKLERKQLEDLIAYKDYPYMVVVNYKSLYKMDVLTGDEVTQDLIEKRKQKIETAHNNHMVNDETYRQEKLYVEFLRTFADMKQHLNSYRLNYRNNSPEINAKNLFAIMQEYKRLKGTFDAREQEFSTNSTYKTIFRPEYTAILSNADLYLESDHNLKGGKGLVNTLRELENNPKSWSTPVLREAALAKLYAVELPKPEYLSASVEGEAVVRLTKKLEDLQFTEVFAQDVQKIAQLQATDQTIDQRNALLEKSAATKCQSCRDKVKDAVTEYNKRYDVYRLQEALKKKNALNQEAEQQVFNYLKRQLCIQNNLQAAVASLNGGADLYINRVSEKNTELANNIKLLDEYNKQDLNAANLQRVQEYNLRLEQLMKDVENDYNMIYSIDKKICNCEAG